ncbi:MAG: hypothetical protein IKB96_10430 [Prevotella sp.]|nr:type II restriction endonuclease [Mogibacterium sp.]MBR2882727.1 hypothetical protein [Prevotella sp.]
MAETIGKTDNAWLKLFEKYPIEEQTKNGGLFEIQADAIKEFREPRLMTKFDTVESVASPLRERGLNILPVSRHSYVIGKFDLYKAFPDTLGMKPTPISLPDYETLRVENLTSESNAINALLVSHTLEQFLNEEEQDLVETFNGRMGTGDFSFDVNLLPQKAAGFNAAVRKTINVSKAQLEIDGGFESQSSICIMEAKNIRHDDFNIRQLYFPYRKYLAMVKKPIRLVFSQYTNLTYYLYEYEFTEPNLLSSIRLINKHAYTFEDCQISMSDLIDTWKKTTVNFNDNQTETNVPFIQADRLDRVIALAERLGVANENAMTTDEVTEFMGTVRRQAAYYPAAGAYLGLFDRSERGKVKLTDIASQILDMNYRERQLAYVRLILRHRIFHNLFKMVIDNGTYPDKQYIEETMLQLNVCNDGATVHRRASSVLSWLNWMISLADDDI